MGVWYRDTAYGLRHMSEVQVDEVQESKGTEK